MGYPFNKKWQGSSSVVSVANSSPHIKLSYFKIYRYSKLQVDELEHEEGDLVVAFRNWMNILEGKES